MEDDNGETADSTKSEETTEGFKPPTTFSPDIENPLEPLVDRTYGQVILGRDRRTHEKLGMDGTVQIGAVSEKQAGGRSLFGYKIRMDIEFPHIMFLCGKRGSGKSYSLGIFAEELGRLRTGIGTVIIDPIGTFWSLKNPNKNPSEISALTEWGLEPKGLSNVLIYTPIGFYNEYRGIVDKPFSISPADLTAEDWCLVFDVERFKTQGLLIGDALEKVRNGYTAFFKNHNIDVPGKPERFSIGDIIQCIETDKAIISKEGGYAQATRRSMIARFSSAARWGLFSTEGTPITELSVPNVVTVIDVSHPKIGDSKRSLIVGIIARKILESRLEASRMEDATSMGMDVRKREGIPVTWLLIDEAHLMLPHSGKTAASDALIEYAKLGRKPGCALILATQRPASTNDDILSQVDLLIGHTLALQDDIAAFRKRVPAMLPKELGNSDFIRSMPVGTALIADQRTQKRTMLAVLRPRLTHHAGRAARQVDGKGPEAEGIGAAADPAAASGLSTGSHRTGDEEKFHGDKLPMEIVATEPLKPTVPLADLVKQLDIVPDVKEGVLPGPEVDRLSEKPKRKGPSKVGKEPKEIVTKTAAGLTEPGSKPVVAVKGGPGIFEHDGIGYSPENLELEDGGLLLILTKNSEAPFKFYRAIAGKYKTPVLSITRTHPKKIKKYFDDKSASPEMFWLSKSAGDKNIGPTNLEKLAHQLNRHMKNAVESGQEEYKDEAGTGVPAAGASGKPPVAILEGLEYLVSNNDFKKVLRFIESLHEKAVLNKGLGILPVNPSAMDERELEMLEREMDICLTYQPGGMKDDVVEPDTAEAGLPVKPERETGHDKAAEPTSELGEKILSLKEYKRFLKQLSKSQMVEICIEFELPGTGSKEELYKRLTKYIAKHKPEKLPGLPEPGGVKKVKPAVPGKDMRAPISGFEKEYKKLDDERNKLREEQAKFLRETLQREHELEMSKLKVERQEWAKKEREFQRRLEELESRAAQISRETSQPPVQKESGLSISKSRDFQSRDDQEAGNVIGPLTVIPKIEHNTLLEIVDKHLARSLLGKKKEQINSIEPVFLPLLRLRISMTVGRLRKKEYVNEIIWDTVSGEQVIDHKKGLKRTEGLKQLYTLSFPQIRLMHELGSFRSREQEELMKETGLTKSQSKRALNKLVEMGSVERKVDTEGKTEHYKRIHKMKSPSHPERVKFEMPEFKPRKNQETILESQFSLKQVQKLLEGLIPGLRITSSENIYYPYFLIELVSEGDKQRNLFIDAVTGTDDKILGNIL